MSKQGERLKKIRKALNLSQEAFGEKKREPQNLRFTSCRLLWLIFKKAAKREDGKMTKERKFLRSISFTEQRYET